MEGGCQLSALGCALQDRGEELRDRCGRGSAAPRSLAHPPIAVSSPS